MKKRAYSLLVTIIVLFLLAGAALFLRYNTSVRIASVNKQVKGIGTTTSTDSSVNSNNTVKIIFSDKFVVSGSTSAKTAFEALTNIAQKNNITVKTKDYDFGKMVERIKDTVNTKEYFWMYKVNSKPADRAADRFEINPGDEVVWEYTKIQN